MNNITSYNIQNIDIRGWINESPAAYFSVPKGIYIISLTCIPYNTSLFPIVKSRKIIFNGASIDATVVSQKAVSDLSTSNACAHAVTRNIIQVNYDQTITIQCTSVGNSCITYEKDIITVIGIK